MPLLLKETKASNYAQRRKVRSPVKSRNRHPAVKSVTPELHRTRLRVGKSAAKAKRLKAPIFNGPLAGKLSTYIRPLDPVWPSEEENRN